MAHCLHKFGELTNWIGYFDLDEYLILKEFTNIKSLLMNYDIKKNRS